MWLGKTEMKMPSSATIHMTLTIVWIVAIIPTLLWWRESVLWVALMSLWANIASHWAAYQASRAERAVEKSEKDRLEGRISI